MAQSRCRKCGKPIDFVCTRNGKYMPVNPKKVWCVKDERGTAQLITPGGQLIRAVEGEKGEPGAIMAYFPHWATCTGANEIKKEQQARKVREAKPRVENIAPEQPTHEQISLFGGMR